MSKIFKVPALMELWEQDRSTWTTVSGLSTSGCIAWLTSLLAQGMVPGAHMIMVKNRQGVSLVSPTTTSLH